MSIISMVPIEQLYPPLFTLSGARASHFEKLCARNTWPIFLNSLVTTIPSSSLLRFIFLLSPGRVQGTMQCAACLERFATLENFTAHTCEKNDKSFKCSVCAKMFARSTLLRQHMVLHQGTKRFKFKCTYCGRAFRHRSHLRDHERIHTGKVCY